VNHNGNRRRIPASRARADRRIFGAHSSAPPLRPHRLASGIGSAPAPAAPCPRIPANRGLLSALRTGLRGSHPGSFEVAHALRDGEAVGQALAGPAQRNYDLVVVGGGISGLSAALFYRDRNPDAHPDPGKPRRFRRPCQAQRIRVRGHPC
jgi:spermidine dehydrogenase